jgi:peptide/nickel transport system substrate-binding protein
LDLFAEGPEGLLLGRQFDLAETTWWLDEPPCRHYVSSEIPGEDRWYGSNPSGFSDPDFDDACEAALGALPGTEAYEDYHRQAQIIFSEQVPGISLFMRLRITAVRPEVRAFGLDPTATSELWDIERLDVAPVE